MLESVENVGPVSELLWWWEVLKLVLPILATVAVGFWISRLNERYKNDLAKEIHKFQTLYPRQLRGLEKLLTIVRGVQKEILRALSIVLDDGFFYVNEEHQAQDLSSVSSRIWEMLDDLREKFDEVRLFLDGDTRDRFETLIQELDSARSMFTEIYYEATSESIIQAQTKEGRSIAEKLVKVTIPGHLDELEQIVRSRIGV